MNQPPGGGPPPWQGYGQGQAGAGQPYVDEPVPQGGAVNPYSPPNAAAQAQQYGYAVPPGRGGPNGEWVACPRCRSPYVNKATFTWWGGVVGPLIIPEVKCATCGNSYNGKTGGPLGTAIAIYLIVVLGVVFVFVGIGVFVMVAAF